MISRPFFRPQSLLRATSRPRLSLATKFLAQQSRPYGHTVPILRPYGSDFTAAGVAGLYSREGYHLAWTFYQAYVVEELNKLTQNTSDADIPAKDVAIKYARNSAYASVFNYASMAFNNHFFFKALSPERTEPSQSMIADINDSFDSIDNLRQEMIETANAMFGPGFVWLMKSSDNGKFRILTTYIAGSPLPQAHFRAQTRDLANKDPNPYLPTNISASERDRLRRPTNTTGFAGQHSTSGTYALHPDQLHAAPVLCVNTWEHAYIRDFGIDQKKKYLAAWWERINWDVVQQECTINEGTQAGKSRNSALANAMSRSFRLQGR